MQPQENMERFNYWYAAYTTTFIIVLIIFESHGVLQSYFLIDLKLVVLDSQQT